MGGNLWGEKALCVNPADFNIGILSETPGADPHAGCLWGLGEKNPRLPDYASFHF